MRHFAALLLFLALAANQAANALQPIPPLSGPVIDLTHTLSASEQQQLSQKLLAFHQKYGAQMQVLIIPTTAPEDAFSYSMRVVDKWKLGTAEKDNGLLLFIAKDDRRSQIQVGYGLEGTIPDAIASRLLNDVMAPYFKQGDFYGGINAVIDDVYARISGDASLAPQVPVKKHTDQIDQTIIVLVFIAFILIKVLKATVGSVVAAMVSGPLVFMVVWLLLGASVLFALIVAFFVLVAALSDSRGGHSGYGGGGFGGGGSSWGGGGGGFGGGGAGGRW